MYASAHTAAFHRGVLDWRELLLPPSRDTFGTYVRLNESYENVHFCNYARRVGDKLGVRPDARTHYGQ